MTFLLRYDMLRLYCMAMSPQELSGFTSNYMYKTCFNGLLGSNPCQLSHPSRVVACSLRVFFKGGDCSSGDHAFQTGTKVTFLCCHFEVAIDDTTRSVSIKAKKWGYVLNLRDCKQDTGSTS